MTRIFKREFIRIFFILIWFFSPPTAYRRLNYAICKSADCRPLTYLPRRGYIWVTVGQRSATYGWMNPHPLPPTSKRLHIYRNEGDMRKCTTPAEVELLAVLCYNFNLMISFSVVFNNDSNFPLSLAYPIVMVSASSIIILFLIYLDNLSNFLSNFSI